MENQNGGDVTPQNDIQGIDEVDFANAEAAKEAYQRLYEANSQVSENNKQLFARAKKAEGFELRNGEWVKPEKPAESKKPTLKSKESAKPSNDLDYGKLAFYNSRNGVVKVEHDDDVEYLRQQIEETGKSQDDILSSSWFASELRNRREAREASAATPKGKPRSGQPVADGLDEAMARYKETGKLPDDFATRNKLIDLITDKENQSMFNGPSVGPAEQKNS